jgi:hypothetical protein
MKLKMMPRIGKGLIGAVVVVTLAALCVSGNEATADNIQTVEQCIDNKTNASVEPFEETLVREGIIREELVKIEITNEVCEEIIARTPGGTPIESAVAAVNVIQELDIIQERMKTAVEGDVNGDGVVDAADSKTASAASYAASHAAQKAARTAIGKDASSTVEESDAELVAQLQYHTYGDGGQYGEYTLEPTIPPPPPPPSDPPPPPPPEIPSSGELQEIAGAAAEDAGASPPAASAGGDCAAEVTLLDGTLLKLVQGNMVFTRPPEEMVWKDDVTISLIVSPSTLTSIEELRQQIEKGAETGEVGSCIGLTNQMEATLTSETDGFAITGDNLTQVIVSDDETQWEWKAVARNTGSHYLDLNVKAHLLSPDGFRLANPPPFSEEIDVGARVEQKAAQFFGNNWQWLWAIIFGPVALKLWRRYKGSNKNIEVTHSSLEFGDHRVGTTSPSQAVTLKSTGKGSLKIDDVALTGTHASDFKTDGQCSDVTLDPDRGCTISVTFTPSDIGRRSASLDITHDAADSPRGVPLSGNGIDT